MISLRLDATDGSIFLEQTQNLARLGVTPFPRLLEYRNAVAKDLEAPATRRDQLDLHVGVSFLQLSRQTGGSWLVVSNSAVFDADLHRRSSRMQIDLT
jgi:hypothetical protein